MNQLSQPPSSSLAAKSLSFPLIAAIVLGLVVALGAAGFDQYFKTPYLESGDIAVNALQIENAKHFREIYGNYSRFEFNHPGPAFFYVYAAGEWLLHDVLKVVSAPGAAHLLASMALQSCFFALALALMAVHLPPRVWLPLALLSAALYFGPMRVPFMSIWPPYVLLMPFLCFLLSCCSVGTGRVDHLPYAIVSGGFLFHGHVAQPLFVGSLGLLALGLCAHQLRQTTPQASWRQRISPYKKVGWVCGGLAGLFFLPLFIDLVTGGTRSNIATIFGRFYANTGDSKSLLQSFLYFVSFATPSENQENIFTTMGPQVGELFKLYSDRVLLWSALFLLTPLFAFVWPSRMPATERRFLLTAQLFVPVVILGCILWGKAQAGPMHHFNGFFYYGVYFFVFLIALGWLDGLVRHAGSAPLAAALCAIAAIAFTWSFRLPRWTETDTGIVTQRAVARALAQSDQRPKLLVFEHKDWPATAGVALDLERHGVGFYMEPWWQFMFGARHNLKQLGAAPEDVTQAWWLTSPGPGGIPLNPEISLFTTPAPLSPAGGEIRLRVGDNGFRYVVYGVSAGNLEHAWSELPRLVLGFLPQSAARDVRVTFDVKSAQEGPQGTKPQIAIVYFNNHEVGKVTARERALLTVTIPRDLWNEKPTGKLELRLPDALLLYDYKRPRHDMWLSWGLWAIRFDLTP